MGVRNHGSQLLQGLNQWLQEKQPTVVCQAHLFRALDLPSPYRPHLTPASWSSSLPLTFWLVSSFCHIWFLVHDKPQLPFSSVPHASSPWNRAPLAVLLFLCLVKSSNSQKCIQYHAGSVNNDIELNSVIWRYLEDLVITRWRKI